MKTTKQLSEKEEAVQSLKKMIKPGSQVFTICRHVAKSGMSRVISCFIARKDGSITNIDWYVSRATGYKRDDKNQGGLKIGGCGMDMGFAVVYSLGRAMYPNGFKLAKGQYGRNGNKSGFDNDGGYAFEQRWL